VEQTIEQVFGRTADRVWLWFGVVPRSACSSASSGREFISLNSLNPAPAAASRTTNG